MIRYDRKQRPFEHSLSLRSTSVSWTVRHNHAQEAGGRSRGGGRGGGVGGGGGGGGREGERTG